MKDSIAFDPATLEDMEWIARLEAEMTWNVSKRGDL
jgi:hypothetical protein